MSTIKTVNIQHPSSSNPSITMDSTGAMTGSFPYPNRNLLYNGAMQIHQRSTSVSGLTTGSTYNTADRWMLTLESGGSWTQSVENDAPTGSGFRKSLKMTCTTSNSSLISSSHVIIDQRLEGQDLQRLFKGTANATAVTLSFWIKSNVTGSYNVTLRDIDNGRGVSAIYSITSANTWEKKTITFPADTTGILDNDNGMSILLRMFLVAGSVWTTGTAKTSWGAHDDSGSAVGHTANVASATNNFWQITGVQLETGPVATPFEFKSYGQELRECQRYYFKTFPQNTAPAQNTGIFTGAVNLPINTGASTTIVWTELSWPVILRTNSPIITTFNPAAANENWRNSAGTGDYTVTVGNKSDRNVQLRAANVLAGQGGYIHVTASAEL